MERMGATPGTFAVAPSRLNPTDATLWDIERDPKLRTTIVAVMLLDRPVDIDLLMHMLEVASRRTPQLRQRVVSNFAGIGVPHWEIDPDFALERHVRVVELPGGVGPAAIAAVAEPMASEPFDRDRPLWEVAYLSPRSGAAALVMKVHHSLTDGVGGIGMLDTLLDRVRDADRPHLVEVPVPVPGPRPPADPTDGDRLFDRVATAPWDAAGAATTAAFHPVRTATGAWEAVRSAGRLLAPTSDALSPLFTDRSFDRRVGMGELELPRLHDAAARHDCTINHAFFAGTVGGIAAYHRALGAEAEHLRVVMPVSIRSSRDGAAGNRWAPVRFVVPTDIDDPVERMLAMRTLVQTSRREKALSFSQSLAGAIQMLPSAVSSGVVGAMMHGIDATLTNVPGLSEPHYLAGAAVERIYAFAPTAGAALNVGFMSHLDSACIGTLSDAAAVEQPDLLQRLVIEGMTEVIEVAEATRPA
jgi:WS/DGAT/MGAT family acyltransferase